MNPRLGPRWRERSRLSRIAAAKRRWLAILTHQSGRHFALRLPFEDKMFTLQQTGLMSFVWRSSCAWLCSALLACGSSDPRNPWNEETTSEPTALRVDLSERLQTLEGFGASIAWYEGFLAWHPNSEELYRLLFSEAGLDIIRMRNVYRGTDTDLSAVQLVVEGAEAALGRRPTLLMSSWSPPPELKASGVTDCHVDRSLPSAQANQNNVMGCTLRRTEDGFPYAAFAQYWVDSLRHYDRAGLYPDYISIQNEPDFTPDGWEGCRFDATESELFPGYDRALDAVAHALSSEPKQPQLVGPETLGIHHTRVQQYLTSLNSDHLSAIAHHLYEDGAWQNPDQYQPSLEGLATARQGLPVFQTEFSIEDQRGDGGRDGLRTAWIIHQALTSGHASAYLYWELIWPNKGLISIETLETERWEDERGYVLTPNYYVLKHYARYTDPGYQRIAVHGTTSSARAVAFISPDAQSLALVLLNTSRRETNFKLELPEGFTPAAIHLTTDDAAWQDLDAVELDDWTLPSRALVTVQATRNDAAHL